MRIEARLTDLGLVVPEPVKTPNVHVKIRPIVNEEPLGTSVSWKLTSFGS